jgi:acyl-CoA synthetase (AMP-forming)/AMP-acid ligase II/acyl carrier protein
MTTVGVIGSCLSNLPATFLVAEYQWHRLNNAVVRRSDHFRRYFVEEAGKMPAYPEMKDFLGVRANNDSDFGWVCLNDDYREHAGRHAMESNIPSFFTNLTTQKFDVFLIDNMFDTHHIYLHYKGPDLNPFSCTFGLHLFDNCERIAPFFEGEGPLSAERSAENWAEILRFLHDVQPQARFFFTCAHYCTSEDEPERYLRASTFHRHFEKLIGHLPVEVVRPLNLPKTLTKLPDDRDHLDMTIYRGLAGQFYLSVAANLKLGGADYIHAASLQKSQSADELPSEPFSLTGIICAFLDLEPGAVNDESGMNVTAGWDSLRQLQVLTHVEGLSRVKFSFNEITDLTTIKDIRKALLARGVATLDDPDYGPSIVLRFVRRAVLQPDAIYAVLIKDGKELSITNQWILAAAVAFEDKFQDIKPGSVVAIVLEHSEYLYSSFIACILHGMTPTVLSPLSAKQDSVVFHKAMKVLFDRVSPAAIITSAAAANALPLFQCPVIFVDTVKPSDWTDVRSRLPDFMKPVQRTQTALLQHSSGTTGDKKGVMLTHAQVEEQIRIYSEAIDLREGDVIASWLPLYHDMGLITSFIMPTLMGCKIISLDPFEWVVAPTMLLDIFERYHANYCWLPNFAFHHIVRADREKSNWDLSSIKAIVSCSEPCRSAAFEAFTARYGSMGLRPDVLKVSYAMAENVFAVTQTSKSQKALPGTLPALAPYLSSGTALPGVEIKILNSEGILMADGDVGEICIRSSCLFSGYYKMPEISAERLKDGWYHTRDLGALYEGELYVIGRIDDLLIINGKNVVAHELEDALAEVTGVAPGRILINSDYDEESGSSRLVVLAEPLTATTDPTALSSALHDMAFALSGIPPHKVKILPKGFLLKSTSGKLARSASFKKFEESVSDIR